MCLVAYLIRKAITCGEIIEEYENDKPYPSMLIYGRAQSERPLHIVCAYSEEDDLAIVSDLERIIRREILWRRH